MKMIQRAFVILATILFVLFLLFPFFTMISTMLKPLKEVYTTPPYWIPKKVAFNNFVEMWRFHPFGRYFLNSFIIAFFTTTLTTVLCLPAAYAVARFRFPAKKVFFYGFLAVQMFSPIVIIISIFKMMSFFHLLDTYLGLILGNTVLGLSFCTWMLSGYFKTIPVDIEESSLIDGCSRIQTIIKIMIPVSAPGVVTVVVYVFILAWNDLIFALALVRSVGRTPVTLGILNFTGHYYARWEYLSGSAFLATIPVIVMFLLIEKNLVKGITGGAVKA